MIRKRISVAASLAIFTVASSALAYLVGIYTVPQALSHAEAWIKNHPERAEGYFFLGAVQGFAWAKGADVKDMEIVELGSGDTPHHFVPWASILFERDAKQPVNAETLKRLTASIVAYRKSVALAPTNARFSLGLAWSLEEAGKTRLDPSTIEASARLSEDETKQCAAAIAALGNADAAQREQATRVLSALMPRNAALLLAVKSDDPEVTARVNSVVQSFWQDQAIVHYRNAYKLSVELDLKADKYDSEADNTVSIKAGERLLSLLSTQAAPPREEIKHIEQSAQAIKAKPQIIHMY